MSKYIIELDENAKEVVVISLEDGDMWTETMEVEDLEQLNSDYINEHFGDLQDTAYQRGLEDGKEYGLDESDMREAVSYQRGLEDAWKAARKISVIELNGGLAGKELMKIYGTMDIHKIYDDNTASEAIAKLKAYEKKQSDKIEVGDEVIYNGTTKCIVVRPEDDERYASLIDSDGTHYSAEHRECKKTGRHFDIQSILEEMRT